MEAYGTLTFVKSMIIVPAFYSQENNDYQLISQERHPLPKMLDLKYAASLARERIINRLKNATQQKHGMMRSVEIIQRQSTFRSHLLDALRRSRDERQAPSPAPDALFIAFPEKLLSRWYYLAYGPHVKHLNKPTW